MTHQDIIDSLEALAKEHSAAYRLEQARIEAERMALQGLCEHLGAAHRMSNAEVKGDQQ